MKRLLTIAICMFVFGLAGCSSYENSNNLPEEDKFLTPSGIHELPHFIHELNTAKTYDVVVYDDINLKRSFKVDNNVKIGYINDVQTIEVSTGSSYFIYENNGDSIKRLNSPDNIFDIIPFNLEQLKYTDFDFIDFSSTYELKQELLDEYNVEGLYISYDDEIENVIFCVREDDDLRDFTITLNNDNIEIPENYEHTLESFDEIELFFKGSSYDSYQSDVYFLDSEQNHIGKYHLQNFHTKEYSRDVYYDANTQPNSYTYIKYNNGDSQYVDINGNPYSVTFPNPEIMEYSVYKNMFVSETKLNPYDLLLDSYYDEESELYYWYCEGIDGLFSIDFSPNADGSSIDPQITIRFRWYDLDDGTLALWTLRYHSFGNVDYNDFMELKMTSSCYVNMIK